MPTIWANFNHMLEVFQGLFFAFFYMAKKWAEDEVDSNSIDTVK